MTKFFKVPGRVRWMKFRPDQLDTKFDDDGVWTVDFYPDEPERMLESGIQVTPKEDEYGVLFRLRRKKMLIWRDKVTKEKKETTFDPPSITIRDGNSARLPFTGNDVGNDTYGILNFSIFDVPRVNGKGHRWEGFEIITLKEYSKTPDPSIPATKEPEATSFKANVDLSDEIPF